MPENLREEALRLLEAQDIFAAIEYLGRQPDALAALNVYGEFVQYFYNDARDLYRVVLLGLAGLQHGLVSAAQTTDPQLRCQLSSAAKSIAYNLASSTWPGWDEPGIVIDSAYLKIGFEAARANLRLAEQLTKGDVPLSRAHWMLGAHSLAAGQYEQARGSFGRAAAYARKAEKEDEALLAEGFSALTAVLERPEDPEAEAGLGAVKAALGHHKHGAFFNAQIETARSVFRKAQ